MTRRLPATIVAVLLCVAACHPADAASPDDDQHTLRIVGSPAMGADLLPDLAFAYLAQRIDLSDVEQVSDPPSHSVTVRSNSGHLAIQVVSAGTGDALDDLRQGRADIAMSARALEPPEQAALAAQTGDHVVARDGLAVVVKARSLVPQLSLDQLRAIFTCQVTDWAQLGATPVTPMTLTDEAAGPGAIGEQLLKGADLCPIVQRFDSDEMLADGIRSDGSAVGLVSSAYAARSRLTTVPLISGTGLSADPSPEGIRTGTYPLSRSLHLYTSPNDNPLMRNFVSFVLSDAGQEVVERAGFVRATPDEPCAGRPDYCNFVRGAVRLPVDIRFATAHDDLDTVAQADVRQLLGYLRTNDLSRQRVLLVGFADVVGDQTSNLALSRRRAATVADRLKAAGMSVTCRGFGASAAEPAPERGDALRLNRRVEVWVVP